MDPREAGFTFVELLVVVVLGLVIIGTVYRTITVQERSYRQQGAMITAQQAMRGALATLEAELREVSATGGDLISIQPREVTFRAYRKVGFVCDASMGGGQLDIAELGEPFESQDNLLVFVDNDPLVAADDFWTTATVLSTGAASCAVSFGGHPTRRVTTTGGSFAGVLPGAPVRSFVPMTYGLYEIDGEWVFGRVAPDDVEPVALIGPLAPPDERGLEFRYFDVNGNQTLDPAAVVRIEIHVRGKAVGGSYTSPEYVDSLTTQLFLRNR